METPADSLLWSETSTSREMAILSENESGDPRFAYTLPPEMQFVFTMLLLRLEACVQTKVKFSVPRGINRALENMLLHIPMLETNRKIPQLPRSKKQTTVKQRGEKTASTHKSEAMIKKRGTVLSNLYFSTWPKNQASVLGKIKVLYQIAESESLSYCTLPLESSGFMHQRNCAARFLSFEGKTIDISISPFGIRHSLFLPSPVPSQFTINLQLFLDDTALGLVETVCR